MKYVLLILAVFGMVVAALALREHYREYGDSPCSINEKWDCGAVNKSGYAVLGGLFEDTGPDARPGLLERKFPRIASIPVADIGIAGYLLLALLAFKRWWYVLAPTALAALAFSLYLAHVEKDVLGVWCVYCVISLAAISLIALLAVVQAIVQLVRRPQAA